MLFLFVVLFRSLILTKKSKRFATPEKPLLYYLWEKWSLAILIPLLMLFLFPTYSPFIVGSIADSNEDRVESLAEKITKNSESDIEKARALYNWSYRGAGNIAGVYNKDILLRIYPLNIYSEYPYFCIRLKGHDNPLWVLTSRCGACDEYSLIYMELADAAGLNVRSIHNRGEDHNWDEVIIDDNSIIVDPSWPKYNSSHSFYDNRRGGEVNLSYAYALYPNGTKKDVTRDYTEVGNITLRLLNAQEENLPNISVQVFSNNYKKGTNTGLSCTSNGNGECTFTLGGGNYTFKAEQESLINPLFNRTTLSVEEGKNKTINIFLKRHWEIINLPEWLEIINSLSACILFWISLIFFLSLQRFEGT